MIIAHAPSPAVHAHLKKHFPDGFYGSARLALAVDRPSSDALDFSKLGTPLLEAIIADPAVSDAMKQVAQVEIDERGGDDEQSDTAIAASFSGAGKSSLVANAERRAERFNAARM